MEAALPRLCLAAILAILGHVMADCDGNPSVNGCSIPFDLDFPFKSKFKPACNRHDVCYDCGGPQGHSRTKCDKAFLGDMVKLCKWWDLSCYKYAGIYYAAVRVAGHSYSSSGLNYCTESWVQPCLP